MTISSVDLPDLFVVNNGRLIIHIYLSYNARYEGKIEENLQSTLI